MNDNLYGFTIRLATEKEIPDILKITKTAFMKYIENTGLKNIEALEETEEDVRRDIKEKLVFVAFINNVPVGSARVKIIDKDTAYLSRFGVVTGNQNQGVGKGIMSVIDGVMKERNIKRLELHTASKYYDLVRFYYGRKFYVDSVSFERGYQRALMIKEY